MKKEEEVEEPENNAPGVQEGIEVKTKFPVARIKRIMQADEDVGKVAQVTPVVVCMCSLTSVTSIFLPHKHVFLLQYHFTHAPFHEQLD